METVQPFALQAHAPNGAGLQNDDVARPLYTLLGQDAGLHPLAALGGVLEAHVVGAERPPFRRGGMLWGGLSQKKRHCRLQRRGRLDQQLEQGFELRLGGGASRFAFAFAFALALALDSPADERLRDEASVQGCLLEARGIRT